MTVLKIDVDRIERRVNAIWEIGRTDRGGVTRLAYSPEETKAIEYLKGELDDRFTVEEDSIGNVFVTTDLDTERSFYLGSHLDSVFNGGRLDGVLGVVTALEAIEAVLDADTEPPVPPTLTVFRAEESARFGQATIGSKGALGQLTVEDFSAVDQSDVPLWKAMQQAGYQPRNLSEPTIDLDRVGAFLELHIEQGRVLDEAGDDIGVVTSIRASVRYQVTVWGADDHSGATPMGLRQDAVAGAAEMIATLEKFATTAAEDGDLVATVGDVTVPEGAINKVSGEVTFPIDVRSNDADYRDDVEAEMLDGLEEIAADRDLELTCELLSRSDPVELDEEMIDRLDAAAGEDGADVRRLPSGGGHDAMNFQRVGIPTGMLFVPSVDGISHNPREESGCDAVAAATVAMARALLQGPP